MSVGAGGGAGCAQSGSGEVKSLAGARETLEGFLAGKRRRGPEPGLRVRVARKPSLGTLAAAMSQRD